MGVHPDKLRTTGNTPLAWINRLAAGWRWQSPAPPAALPAPFDPNDAGDE